LVRETGRGNRVAVLSRDKADVHVSRGGGINDRGKRMGEWYLEKKFNYKFCMLYIFVVKSCK